MLENKQAEIDKEVGRLKALEAVQPQDGEAIAKLNAKIDALRKALTEPVKPVAVKPVGVKPFIPFGVVKPLK